MRLQRSRPQRDGRPQGPALRPGSATLVSSVCSGRDGRRAETGVIYTGLRAAANPRFNKNAHTVPNEKSVIASQKKECGRSEELCGLKNPTRKKKNEAISRAMGTNQEYSG